MEVLTIIDRDGHMHVYNVSTSGQKQKILKALLHELINNGYIHNKNAVAEAEKLFKKNWDSEKAIDLINDHSDAGGFERSGGGFMYISEVKREWKLGNFD